MAFLLSPGVLVREFDFTTIVPGVASTPGGYVGAFQWGPVQEVVLLNDENGLLSVYNLPNNETFVDWFTCANFLAYGSNLQVCRVIGSAAMNAVSSGTPVVIKNSNDYEDNYADAQGEVGPWAAKYPGALGNSLKVVVADQMADAATYNAATYSGTNKISDIFVRPTTTSYVTDRTGLSDLADEMHILVIDEGGLWTGTKGTVLERFGFVSKASDAKRPDGSSNYYKNVMNNESRFIWWMDQLDTSSGIGSVTINSGGQSYSAAPTVSFAAATGATGAAATASLATAGGVASVTVATGGTGYSSATVAFSGGGGTGAAGTVTITGNAVSGVVITVAGTGYTSVPTVTISGDGTGAAGTAALGYAVASVTVTSSGTGYTAAPAVSFTGGGGTGAAGTAVLSNIQGANNTADLGSAILTLTSTNKFKLINPSGTAVATQSRLSGGVSDEINVDNSARQLGWDIFKNADTYDVSLVPTGAADSVLQQYIIDNLAETRRDLVAFVSPALTDVKSNLNGEAVDVVTARNMLSSSSYSVMDSGWKYMYDKYNDVFRWVPLNGDIAGLCARSDYLTDPWFSPAGYNRGGLKGVVKLAWSPNQAERDMLYMNGINPVVTFPGDGTILYGDKTMQAKPSAFDRINVRRLFIVIEKAIAKAAKYELFEFNDEFTRAMFRNMVEPYLRDVQGRRGITDFEVVCDETNNTGQVIDSNSFVADIKVKPARSINFIYLNFIAVGTTVSFNEIGSPGV